ncbi:hypothetical protein UFOVP998_31 [uncultured Caudovirales phage]|uniref:Terminase n=1 Tax=uncultured Caudovirales phage TaxID=2100421 RepID=A0A6J5Q7D1_9CAUD|nr:hypothetical protein UFOVP998_31 [uncultured Caudovirales phage]CAB4199208.1 hypothetical protein UFOVP1331_28 [uncultured Caudovirales phage]CAB4213041.1 hypothetical protein UFOVP1442_47 [uncultured Caudovirales phage]CAB5227937.1 hypothetical protein UFOVP1535_4 [uncultured Caudovirales phage]
MGGKGSGGRRPGTGPKPKSRHLHLVDGTTRRGDEVVQPTKPADEFPAPSDLFGEDLMTWEAMAPLAFEQRTLTKATAYAFSLLCRNIVMERGMATQPMTRGTADHRGLIQRIDAELLAFNLRPNGKAIYEAEPATGAPVNPLARFGFGAR